MSDPTNPNPLPQPAAGPVNRMTQTATQPTNGAPSPDAAATPQIPQTISSVEDVLTFLSAHYPCVVIAVSRKRAGAPVGAKPPSVQVLHAGDAQEAVRLAGVAAGVLQGA